MFIYNGALPQTPLGFFKVRIVRSSAYACGAGPMLTHHALAPQCFAHGLPAYSKENLHVVPTARKFKYMTKPPCGFEYAGDRMNGHWKGRWKVSAK